MQIISSSARRLMYFIFLIRKPVFQLYSRRRFKVVSASNKIGLLILFSFHYYQECSDQAKYGKDHSKTR